VVGVQAWALADGAEVLVAAVSAGGAIATVHVPPAPAPLAVATTAVATGVRALAWSPLEPAVCVATAHDGVLAVTLPAPGTPAIRPIAAPADAHGVVAAAVTDWLVSETVLAVRTAAPAHLGGLRVRLKPSLTESGDQLVGDHFLALCARRAVLPQRPMVVAAVHVPQPSDAATLLEQVAEVEADRAALLRTSAAREAELRAARLLLDSLSADGAAATAPTAEQLRRQFRCELRETRHWSAERSCWQPAVAVAITNLTAAVLTPAWTRTPATGAGRLGRPKTALMMAGRHRGLAARIVRPSVRVLDAAPGR